MILDAKYNLFYMWIINPIENRRGNQDWTIQRKPKGHSRLDNSGKTEGAIKIGQFRDTGNIGRSRHMTKTFKTNKTKRNKAKQTTSHCRNLQRGAIRTPPQTVGELKCSRG